MDWVKNLLVDAVRIPGGFGQMCVVIERIGVVGEGTKTGKGLRMVSILSFGYY